MIDRHGTPNEDNSLAHTQTHMHVCAFHEEFYGFLLLMLTYTISSSPTPDIPTPTTMSKAIRIVLSKHLLFQWKEFVQIPYKYAYVCVVVAMCVYVVLVSKSGSTSA